jgi:uncharacterized membrane protein
MTSLVNDDTSPFERWLDGGLLGPLKTVGGAVIVAAGPWLVAVAALALVSVTMTPVLGFAAIEDLRLTVVYAFCIAPLVAGPIGVVAARLIVEEYATHCLRQAPAIFFVSAGLSGLVTQMLAIAVAMGLGLDLDGLFVGFVFLSSVAALLWTSFAVLTALRDFRFLIGAFTGGMAFSLGCIVAAAQGKITTEHLVWSFTSGAALCVCLAMARVRGAVHDTLDIQGAASALIGGMWRQRDLCLGVLLAVSAVWVDKWIYWLGHDGGRSAAGYLHFSAYDSVMFVAHISVVPSYAAMLLLHEGDLRESVGRVRVAIRDAATYDAIRTTIDRLCSVVWSRIFSIVFLQAALTACMVLMAPALAKALNFSFDQFLMLRVGLIAVFLHAVFYLSCGVVLVCNRMRHFAWLQGGLFITNLVFGMGFYGFLGPSAHGFFFAALLMSVAAFFVAYKALYSFDFLTFLGENETLFRK